MSEMKGTQSMVAGLCRPATGSGQPPLPITSLAAGGHFRQSTMPLDEAGQGTILVVDDADVNRKALAELLTAEHFYVAVATDGSRAPILAQQLGPDLILLNVKMPVMDGFQICRHLKQDNRTKGIPVIFTGVEHEAFDKAYLSL